MCQCIVWCFSAKVPNGSERNWVKTEDVKNYKTTISLFLPQTSWIPINEGILYFCIVNSKSIYLHLWDKGLTDIFIRGYLIPPLMWMGVQHKKESRLLPLVSRGYVCVNSFL